MSNSMAKIIGGVMKYRKTYRADMVKQFKIIKDNPDPSTLIISCADSRVLPSRFTQTNIGDAFFIRNAGNVIPHATNMPMAGAFGCSEPAVLELACVVNRVKDIVVCGHSDCKAMNILYNVSKENIPATKLEKSQLQTWMIFHGQRSMELFEHLKQEGWDTPLVFMTNTCTKPFRAFVDVEKRFSHHDRLSQINTLQQLQNITTYDFLRHLLVSGELELHAMWFDIYTGEVYYFSKKNERFVEINDETYKDLVDEASSKSANVSST